MIKRLLPLLLTLVMIGVAPTGAAAVEMLNVKLVKLTHNGKISPGLEGVAAIIQRNLPYNGCEQVDQKACVLPANATLAFRHDYQMILKSRDTAVDVTITRKKRMLISTSITLKAETPVLVGGFYADARGTKHIFVLQRGE